MMETVDSQQPKKTARGGSQTMFPGRLHELLESFTRQLNMWSFQREEVGPFKGSFSNPYFVKHDKSLCAKMRRHEPKLRVTVSSQANTSKTSKTQASLEGSSVQSFENKEHISQSLSSATKSEKLSPGAEPDYNPILDLESLPIGIKPSHWLNDEEMSSSLLFHERMSPLKQDQSISAPCHPIMQAPLSWLSAQSPLSSSDHLNNLDGSLFHLDTTDALEPTPILEVSQCPMPADTWGGHVEMIRDDVFPIIAQLEELESRFQFPGSSTSLPLMTQSDQYRSLSQSLDNDDEAQYLLKLLQTQR